MNILLTYFAITITESAQCPSFCISLSSSSNVHIKWQTVEHYYRYVNDTHRGL